MPFETFLLDLAVILIAAKLGGEIAERLKQPAVLGELVAGILVGASVLGACGGLPLVGPVLASLAIDGHAEMLKTVAEVGAVLLLFEAGLESDIHELRRLGPAALWVAVAGVALPFALGYGAAHLLGLSFHAAIFLGAALTATSVGITARTFADLKAADRAEAKIVLGAAVADDVLGLIILAVVSGMAAGAAGASSRSPIAVVAFALLFLVGALVVGIKGAPHILRFVSRMRTRAALATSAVIFCFLLAALAHRVGGLAPIVGAFAAGLVLSTTEHRFHFEERIKPIADIFIPVFFVLMGAAMPIGQVNPLTPAGRAALALAAGLTVVAVIGKVLGGLTVPARGISRLAVGVGMIPRGEVGLIFASVGLDKKLITGEMFTALVLMVMATTFVTPPLLKLVLGGKRKGGVPSPAEPEEAPATAAGTPPLPLSAVAEA
jgi:Kef-type K+ transport system membrane component KefB